MNDKYRYNSPETDGWAFKIKVYELQIKNSYSKT